MAKGELRFGMLTVVGVELATWQVEVIKQVMASPVPLRVVPARRRIRNFLTPELSRFPSDSPPPPPPPSLTR